MRNDEDDEDEAATTRGAEGLGTRRVAASVTTAADLDADAFLSPLLGTPGRTGTQGRVKTHTSSTPLGPPKDLPKVKLSAAKMSAVTKDDLQSMAQTMSDAFANLFRPASPTSARRAGPLAPLVTNAGNQGSTRKIQAFTEADDPVEWAIWRQKFEMVADIAGWNDDRKRQELFANMSGAAARAVADIGAGRGTYADVVARYEGRFMTPAASELSRGEFYAARQMADESILEWHARCRSLYLRAYPGSSAAGTGAEGIQLRERFARGLESDTIREYVWDQRPTNYANMLTSAQNKLATLTMMATAKNEAKGADKKEGEDGVHAVKKPKAKPANRFMGGNYQCFLCESKDHIVRSCPLLDKAKAALTQEDDQASGAKWKKRKNKGKDEKKPWRKGVNHLVAGEEEEEDPTTDEDDLSSSEEEN